MKRVFAPLGCSLALLVAFGGSSAQAAGQWFPKFDFGIGNAPGSAPNDQRVAVDRDANVYTAFRLNDSPGAATPSRASIRVRSRAGVLSTQQELGSSTNETVDGLTVSAGGTATVVWRDNTNTSLHARRRNADGSLSADQTIVGAGHAGAGGHSAAGSDGNTVFAWFDYVDNRIHIRRWAADGTLGPDLIVSPLGMDVNYLSTAIGAAPDGTSYVSWVDDGDGSVKLVAVSPAGVPGAMETVGPATTDQVYTSAVGADALGNAFVMWVSSAAPAQNTMRLRVRNALGMLSAVEPVSDVSSNFEPVMGVGSDGSSAFAWHDGTKQLIVARHRSAAGVYGAMTTISTPGDTPQNPAISVERGGNAVVAWNPRSPVQIHARGFRTDDSLDPIEVVSGAENNVFRPEAANDGFGNTGIVWQDAGGKKIDGAVFDGGGPELRSLSAPATLERTVAGSFSFTPVDLLSSVTGSSWDFADGTPPVAGTSATHAFAKAGDVTVHARSADAAGNLRDEPIVVRVVDTRKPKLSSLKLSPRAFRVGRKPTARSSAARAKTGTKISFRVSEDAKVTFAVQKRAPGRRVGRSCKRPTTRNKSRRSCTRYVTVLRFTRSVKEGRRKVAFSGRVGRRTLARGGFRLSVIAADPSGNKSRARTKRFKVK